MGAGIARYKLSLVCVGASAAPVRVVQSEAREGFRDSANNKKLLPDSLSEKAIITIVKIKTLLRLLSGGCTANIYCSMGILP